MYLETEPSGRYYVCLRAVKMSRCFDVVGVFTAYPRRGMMHARHGTMRTQPPTTHDSDEPTRTSTN